MSNFQVVQETLQVDLGQQHEVANPYLFFIIVHFEIYGFSYFVDDVVFKLHQNITQIVFKY